MLTHLILKMVCTKGCFTNMPRAFCAVLPVDLPFVVSLRDNRKAVLFYYYFKVIILVFILVAWIAKNWRTDWSRNLTRPLTTAY